MEPICMWLYSLYSLSVALYKMSWIAEGQGEVASKVGWEAEVKVHAQQRLAELRPQDYLPL